MTVLAKSIATAALFLPLALAAPRRHSAHFGAVDVVTVTDWTTVYVTETGAENAPAAPTIMQTLTSDAAFHQSFGEEHHTPPSDAQPQVIPGATTTPQPVEAQTPAPAQASVQAPDVQPSIATSAAPLSQTHGSNGGFPTSGSEDGTCEGESNPCEGDITHWDGSVLIRPGVSLVEVLELT